jgi:hypothetical protein
LEEIQSLEVEEKVRRAKAKADLEKVALLQEMIWKQKFSATWLKEGNNNTRCFHCLANSHRRNNFISSLCTITFDQEWQSMIRSVGLHESL